MQKTIILLYFWSFLASKYKNNCFYEESRRVSEGIARTFESS